MRVIYRLYTVGSAHTNHFGSHCQPALAMLDIYAEGKSLILKFKELWNLGSPVSKTLANVLHGDSA